MHTLIMGRCETGKTTLAKILVKQLAMQGRQAVILDPLASDWGSSATIFSDVDSLMEYCKDENNASKVIVIDESAISLDRYDATQLWLAKVSRHNGHCSIFIGQDFVDIPKGFRTQCSQLFIFACDRKESKELASKYNADIIEQAPTFPVGHFIRILVNRSAVKGYIEFKNKTIFLQKNP